MAIPTNENAINNWAKDHSEHVLSAKAGAAGPEVQKIIVAASKPNWLTRLLGWDAKLIVITDPGTKEKHLEYRTLKWGEWFDAVRGKLEGVTMPAIAQFCKNQPNGEKLQQLYKHYVEQGIEKIEKNDPGAKKVASAALLLKNAELAPLAWKELCANHPKAALELYKKLPREQQFAYLTDPILKQLKLADVVVALGTLQPSLTPEEIARKAGMDPVVAFKLGQSDQLFGSREEQISLLAPELLTQLAKSGYKLDQQETAQLLEKFPSLNAEQQHAALQLKSVGEQQILWSEAHARAIIASTKESLALLLPKDALPHSMNQTQWDALRSFLSLIGGSSNGDPVLRNTKKIGMMKQLLLSAKPENMRQVTMEMLQDLRRAVVRDVGQHAQTYKGMENMIAEVQKMIAWRAANPLKSGE